MAITKLQPFNLDATANYTFANVTASNVNGANLVSANYITGTLTTNAQPNITSVGTLTSLDITGNVTSGNANLGNAVNANYFIGNFYGTANLATYATTANSVAGANVSGQVANALVSSTVYTNAQPNITSVGTLSNLAVTGNISAGNVLTDNLLYANGVAWAFGGGTPGGSNTFIQFNDGSTFGGNAGLTFNKTTTTLTANNFVATTTANLGNVGNVRITGGSSSQYLQTDGTGNLAWVSISSSSTLGNGNSSVSIPAANGNINITAVGNTTAIVTGTGVNVSGTLNVTGQSNLGAVGNVVITGGTNGYVLQTDGAGSLSWVAQSGGGGGASISNGTSNVNIATANGNVVVGVGGTANVVTFTSAGNVNVLGNIITGSGLGGNITGVNSIDANSITSTLITGTITTNAQPNITSLGSLTGLTVSNATGVVDFATTANVTLGSISNLRITGGSSGFGLVTDGSGALSFANITSVITNNNSVNATYYPVYATVTSGNLTVAGISSTKMQFNPSSGQLTVTDLNTTSDAVLKNNVESIDDPITVIRQLFGVGFNWVDTGKKSYGLIAQMLEKVLPELVNVNEQGTKTVSYIPIIAFLIEAIKKQQDDIDMLKSAKR